MRGSRCPEMASLRRSGGESCVRQFEQHVGVTPGRNARVMPAVVAARLAAGFVQVAVVHAVQRDFDAARLRAPAGKVMASKEDDRELAGFEHRRTSPIQPLLSRSVFPVRLRRNEVEVTCQIGPEIFQGGDTPMLLIEKGLPHWLGRPTYKAPSGSR